MWRLLKWLLAAGALLFVVIQLVPYGRDHDNPPVLAEPAWDSPATRELAVRACFDCHSNETIWAWYSNIAPISWLVQRDVNQGREEVNWSEWGPESEGDESAETVLEGSMPPRAYTLVHPDARLTEQEMDALAAGLAATFGSEDHEGESGGED
jgi:mono/diheme cytochrome c family protein